MFKVDARWKDEVLSVEECSNSDFDAGYESLYLETLDLRTPDILVSFKDGKNVKSIIFLSDERKYLVILGFSTRLDNISFRIRLNELYGGIKGGEFPRSNGL